MHFSGQHTFPQSREEIFDFFTDIHNEPRWNPQLNHVEQISPGPVGQGTRWMLDYQQVGRMDVLTSVFERPAHVAWQVRSDKMDMDIVVRFEPTPEGGCAMTAESEVEVKGFLKMVQPIVQLMMEKDFANRGQQVQRAYEARH